MPKSKEYISSSEDSDEEPKPKKQKPAKKEEKPEQKEKSGASGSQKTERGDVMLQLSKMRYVNVTVFNGRKMVNIREYYDKDGDLRPGKKGIALSLEQWGRLKEHMGEIDDMIKDL